MFQFIYLLRFSAANLWLQYKIHRLVGIITVFSMVNYGFILEKCSTRYENIEDEETFVGFFQ